MKKFLTLFLTAVLLCSVNLYADRAGYTIRNYRFDGVYHSDNTISVKETIEVNFEEPRHGIYRQIPEYFYLTVLDNNCNESTKRYTTKVKDFSAGDDHFEDDDNDGYRYFKIGSSLKELTGRKTYELTYTYIIPDDRTKTADYIFYSVLGAEWETTIDHFSYSMTFDNGLPSDIIIYSGDYGETDNGVQIQKKTKGKTVYGEANNLEPNTAITIYAEVPEGYFTKETVPVPVFLPWFLFALALAVSGYAGYLCITSEAKTPVQTVEFYPPSDISSSEVGTIIDNSADTEDLVSLIPLFASKGYLKIKEEKEKYRTKVTLEKIKDLPSNAPVYQKTFFKGLFDGKNTISLDNIPDSFIKNLDEAKTQLKDFFKKQKKLYDGETKAYLLPIITSALSALALANDSPVELLYNFSGFILPVIFFFMSFFITGKSFKRNFHKKGFIIRIIIYAVLAFFAVGIYVTEITDGLNETILPWWCSIILLTLDFAVCVFSYRIIVPTDWNVEITGKLMGLKEFIKTAELPKLKMLIDENPEYFYDILPYAMVFELTNKWTDKFQTLNVKEPDWYHSTTPGMFSAHNLVHSIDSGITHCISESVAKSSASSSGGGYSGGGGGGGGGGSW